MHDCRQRRSVSRFRRRRRHLGWPFIFLVIKHFMCVWHEVCDENLLRLHAGRRQLLVGQHIEFTLLPSSVVFTGDPQLSHNLASSTSFSTFIHSASPLPPTMERVKDSRKIKRLELFSSDWSISPLKHRQQVFYRDLRRVAAFRVSPPAGLPELGRGKISASFPHRTLKKNGQKVGKERSSVGKFSALGHATRPSYGGQKIDPLDFQLDFALWNFAS